MSVINQVLSDLEKRGINALPNEPAIRAIPAQRSWVKPALLAAAMAILALLLALQWNRFPLGIPAQPAERTFAIKNADHAIPTVTASGTSESSTPFAQPLAEPAPVTLSHEASREKNLQPDEVIGTPAMRMSPELSSIPLPSSLRPQSLAAAISQFPGSSYTVTPDVPESSARTTKPRQHSPAGAGAKQAAASTLPAPSGSMDKQVKQLSPQQQADIEFRQANEHVQQGSTSEALAGYRAALQLDPSHDAARQAAVGLLLKNRRGTEAEQVLQQGLERNPANGNFAMLLARLQVERNAVQPALDTLLKTLPHVGQQPDYQAFVAALLQRLEHHQDAVTHYRIALKQSPGSSVWLMGLGISLQALQRTEEARDAFKLALESRTLNAELQTFVRQRLKEL